MLTKISNKFVKAAAIVLLIWFAFQTFPTGGWVGVENESKANLNFQLSYSQSWSLSLAINDDHDEKWIKQL